VCQSPDGYMSVLQILAWLDT